MNFISTFYLRYASLGLATIPIKTMAYATRPIYKDAAPDREAKQPLVDWKIYQQRVPTHDELLAWGKQWPSSGIAIVCGAVSNAVCVDDDTKSRPSLVKSERDEHAEA